MEERYGVKTWAQLLARVFGIDALARPSCPAGRLRLISLITQPETVRKSLVSVGLPSVAPRASPARAVEQVEIEAEELARRQPA